ncbi:MAG: putative acyltransferase [Hyphomicrobiales bacterium]|nr:putative acyltransferase [Hyphomicrobiales bacterium]
MARDCSEPTGRLETLDAIRGLAALVVVINHTYYTIPEAWQAALSFLNVTPLRVLALGKPAVVVFFVLSGFVLALSLMRGRSPTYADFIIRRIFRIYVPFAISILIAAALVALIDPHPIAGLNAFFNNEIWSGTLTPAHVAAHLLMLNGADDITLNNAMWSLVIEMRLSLIFPLLLAAALMHRHAAIVLAASLSAAAAGIYMKLRWPGFPYTNETAAEGLLLTLYFAHCFAFGILLAIYKTEWFAALASLGSSSRAGLWLLAWATLSLNLDLLNSVGAVLIISLSQTSARARNILSTPLLAWLGRISFSLYLMHLIVIATAVHLLHGRLPLLIILALAIGAAFLAAQIFHVAVEMPSQRLGRRLTSPARKLSIAKDG